MSQEVKYIVNLFSYFYSLFGINKAPMHGSALLYYVKKLIDSNFRKLVNSENLNILMAEMKNLKWVTFAAFETIRRRVLSKTITLSRKRCFSTNFLDSKLH